MSKDLTGLGDNDIEDLDRRRRNELRAQNPMNEAEVTLEMWTVATLTRDAQVVGRVVFGVVTRCLTDDYMLGAIACSPPLYDIEPVPEKRIYVSQWLRFECRGLGREVTIPENELQSRLPDPGADSDDIKHRIEGGEL
jgi:hypothetical protein